MYLPDFEYYAPDNIAEACKLLTQFGEKAKLLAGGTDIIIKMKKKYWLRKFLFPLRIWV